MACCGRCPIAELTGQSWAPLHLCCRVLCLVCIASHEQIEWLDGGGCDTVHLSSPGGIALGGDSLRDSNPWLLPGLVFYINEDTDRIASRPRDLVIQVSNCRWNLGVIATVVSPHGSEGFLPSDVDDDGPRGYVEVRDEPVVLDCLRV